MSSSTSIVPEGRVENSILMVRGLKVLLDTDLAILYGVEPRALTQAVRRNIERFPEDFMFQLNSQEFQDLRSLSGGSRFQIIGRGGRRSPPYAFTEQGVAMLSSVLTSPRAIHVNIAIMRAFVRLRQLLTDNERLARKLRAMEKKYDGHFKAVFDAIAALMEPIEDEPKKSRIGFKAD